jgi:Secretion system C-terminal sorting domain
MKKLLLLFFVIVFSHSITKAQCPPGAFAYLSADPLCSSGCSVLLLGWPEGTLVNIYGGTPLEIVGSAPIPGVYGNGGIDNAYTCVPCNIPLIFASTTPGATGGCVIATIGIVPVKLTEFSANTSFNGGACLLKWTVSQEIGGAKYTVQKSDDGRSFIDITTVKSYNNGKTSNTYSYEDATQVKGNKYYRLKIVEISGAINYSPTAIVKSTISTGFTIYPNPVLNYFSVTIAEKLLPATVEIYNAQGQSLYKLKTNQNILNIDKNLNTGVYALKVTGNNNISTTQKFIKR